MQTTKIPHVVEKKNTDETKNHLQMKKHCIGRRKENEHIDGGENAWR